MGGPDRRAPRVPVALVAGLAGLLIPTVASAHALSGRVQSPLPFLAYVAGAGVAVAVSFLLIALSDPGPPADAQSGRIRAVPGIIRLLLRALGLMGWLWVVVQTIIGGSSDADVASLFLWVYGWVGLAILSALLGPVWRWIDPFTTLHDLGAWLLRRLRIQGIRPQPWPERLSAWPAVIGFAFVIWLELVAKVGDGRLLGMTLIAYTLITLVGMAQYGRDPWRGRGETFGVWFALLGRLALYAPMDEGTDRQVRRRPFGAGLVSEPWTAALLVLLALGTGSIIYDGLSQTELFFEQFGIPDNVTGTLIMVAFLATLVCAVLFVARRVGDAAMGAGLLPVAVGYLIAHYLSTLLIDGQRIVVALSDPFQQGWDLFGTAFAEAQTAWLPTEAMWTIQVAAVVVGHIVGAWAGHAAARRSEDGSTEPRRSQLPLGILMVALTAITLWSLGHYLVFEGHEAVAVATRAMAGG